jgi:hypothetical protein
MHHPPAPANFFNAEYLDASAIWQFLLAGTGYLQLPKSSLCPDWR